MITASKCHLIAAGVVAAAVAAVAATLVPTSTTASAARPSPGTATIVEFAPALTGSASGLAPKASAPLRYGPPAVVTDSRGDAIDAHDGKLAFLRGEYWWYGTAYGCGYRFELPGLPLGGRNAGFCGFATYTSRDLDHWTERSPWLAPQLRSLCGSAGCLEPRVIYTPRLHRYLMWFGAASRSLPEHFFVAESASPAGPWHHPRPATLAHPGAGDFDVYVDHRGRGWIVTADLDYRNPATDAIHIERLNADYTSGTGEQATVAGGARETPSLFQRGRSYYLTVSDPACGYCHTATGTYVADDPLGHWRTPAGGAGSTAGSPPATIISHDSCGGQPRTVSELPSASGPVYLLQVDLWRTSPSDFGSFGDRNQAIAGRYWVPLRWDHNGIIQPYRCRRQLQVALADDRVAPRSTQVDELDCRASRGSTMVQRWVVPPGRELTAVTVPVFQRPQDHTDVSEPLELRVRAGGHVDGERILAPDKVRFSPRERTVALRSGITGGRSVTLELRSAETAGCYGGLIGSHRRETGWSYSAGAPATGVPRAALQIRPTYLVMRRERRIHDETGADG